VGRINPTNTEPRRWTFAADAPAYPGREKQAMSKSNLNLGTFPLATGTDPLTTATIRDVVASLPDLPAKVAALVV
jgi:hypothetical protein